MKKEVVYLEIEEATELVERIAKRAEKFDYIMCEAEKESMSQLLSDIGVQVKDIICVKNLADNYVINAEIVCEENMIEYERDKDDCLFMWIDNDIKTYCMSW